MGMYVELTGVTHERKMVALRYFDALGRKRVCGGAGLKATQLYTPEFGRAVAMWWTFHSPTSSGTEWMVLV